jgi:hypothetical protein
VALCNRGYTQHGLGELRRARLRVRSAVEHCDRQLRRWFGEHGFSESDCERSTRFTARRCVQVRACELGFMACTIACGNRAESAGISMGVRRRTSGCFR